MKTAMQWLKEQYIERGETIPLGVFEEALEKEKVQIKRAFEFGIADAYNFIEDDAEQYYNETYNQ